MLKIAKESKIQGAQIRYCQIITIAENRAKNKKIVKNNFFETLPESLMVLGLSNCYSKC